MAKHSILQTFYASTKWRNFRLGLINERGNRCQRCSRIILKTIDIIGHHKTELTPENVHDYNISLNPEMVELVCSDCHNEEHGRFGFQKTKSVFIVYGPPMSGKKEFVRQQLQRGDLVVDMDALYEAVSGLPYYDKPDVLFNNVIGLLIDNIKTRLGKWGNAWVIGGFPERFKRERMAQDLGAEMIFCEASRDECMARLAADNDRRHRQAEWRGYIDKWFENYQK
ncbi:HNH endonuclease [Paenibacillus sp. OAS669]|uniref:HNH endonuclease n=1 Tax=Paenibacillus sp. OAS669 TaxID=2663821 RepID=UPI00178A1D69|nr:HNH endonuclease [Paenibacillus sp. OAS669]MBE1446808.1 hypothetical protein [Paenibacillus sp. OAS669]